MSSITPAEDTEPVISCRELDWPGHGRTLLIKIGRTLDVCNHGAFRCTYANSSPDILNYIVDFSDTRWIDPSVLGMLLLLRRHAGGDRRRIHITGAGYRVRDALAGANIHALFSTDSRLLPEAAGANGLADDAA